MGSTTEMWAREPGTRLQGSRGLDSSKLQSPCIVPRPEGGWRLFYIAIGPARPFTECQGYVLSAVAGADGVDFTKEEGVRLAPVPGRAHMSRRLIAPTVMACDGGWRMYLEARGPADELTVISSAFSADMLSWEHEDGFRLSHPTMGFGGPRIVSLPGGGGLRLYLFTSVYADDGPAGAGEGADPSRLEQGVMSATSADGLNFSLDPGWRLRGDVPLCDRAGRPYPSIGITAADVLPPALEVAPDETVILLHPLYMY